MINPVARRFTFALVLGLSSVAAVDVTFAQSKTTASTATPAGGVTGTDPVPPPCCKPTATVATGSTTTNSATSGSSAGAAMQALLVLLGLA